MRNCRLWICLGILAISNRPILAAEKVGNVGAANFSAYGTPPGRTRQTLAVGLGVEKGERLETSQEGNAQIVFNDTSTLTIGHNSSVVIDEFVSRSDGGELAQGARFMKGAMRFVGGAVSHASGAKFNTPTAQIGVRGGSFLSRIGGDCGTLVVHQAGRIEVRSLSGDLQILTRPGFGVCVSEKSVSEPFRVKGEIIAQITSDLSSHGSQHGGAAHIPGSEEAVNALGNGAPASVDLPPGLEALGPIWAGNSIVQSGANVNNQPAPPPPAPDPAPVPTPPSLPVNF